MSLFCILLLHMVLGNMQRMRSYTVKKEKRRLRTNDSNNFDVPLFGIKFCNQHSYIFCVLVIF